MIDKSKAKPILFNTDMVRAILDGRKTVTRRVLKIQPWITSEGTEWECRHEKGFYDTGSNDWACRKCGVGIGPPPYRNGHASLFNSKYQKGDVLYVRETWQYAYDIDDKTDRWIEETGRYLFYADNPMPFTHWVDGETGEHKDYMPWKPSIHMPKEAARIWLRVTDVRVERLQDITEEQSKREGISEQEIIKAWNSIYKHKCNTLHHLKQLFGTDNHFIYVFKNLFNSTIKKQDFYKYSWQTNPWVWVYEFERVEE